MCFTSDATALIYPSRFRMVLLITLYTDCLKESSLLSQIRGKLILSLSSSNLLLSAFSIKLELKPQTKVTK